jgi:hypothetical protein
MGMKEVQIGPKPAVKAVDPAQARHQIPTLAADQLSCRRHCPDVVATHNGLMILA